MKTILTTEKQILKEIKEIKKLLILREWEINKMKAEDSIPTISFIIDTIENSFPEIIEEMNTLQGQEILIDSLNLLKKMQN